ncbi:hypothetical protein LOTGIDRAFT_182132 [Lottia gigantea]|uniref:Gamma-glutamyltransferase n=1 Tax=Lottia gigantea TaxID=225164 RepID=V4BXA9_LOTGI|nr:hypothetical protein LOTGIDRAFT_182132 [Lottia gigantea]ESO93724.1 hypothetical protein LOTGIDRAFT_182132 [Lottia gigantea]
MMPSTDDNAPLYEEGEPLIYDPDFQHFHKERLKKKRRLRFVIALLISLTVLFLMLVALFLITNLYTKDDNEKGSKSKLGDYKHAAVAADVEQCSRIGKDILKKDGNAVDASIAALLCMGVADPQSMGIGGGFFMTVYEKAKDKVVVIDARETAPGKATEDMYVKHPGTSSRGPLSIAVPGELKGYWQAHQEFGALPWKDLFKPAIKMCLDGFKIPGSLGRAIQKNIQDIQEEPSLREVFVNPETGEVYKTGEIMKREKLGKTLKTIAEEKMESFYTGSLSKLLLEDLKKINSIITAEDLKNYKAIRKEPLKIKLNNGLSLYSPPPPASGAVLSFILNILDGYDLTKRDVESNKKTVLTYHRMIEAFKFAYAKRTDLADEDFVNVTDLVANLTSRDYADFIRSKIWDNTTHDMMYYGPTFYDKYTTSTAHLSIVDQHGNAVSVTSTINARFGSKLRGLKTGIIFNDEMDDFSSPNITNIFGIPPSPANFIRPGKRPLSSMCPAIAIDKKGDVKLVIGAAGGSKITTATALVTMNELWLGRNIKKSIDTLRLHHQLLPPEIQYEKDFDQDVLIGLVKKGHNISEVAVGESVVQGVARHDHRLYANCDFRKGGEPAGF